MGVTYTGQRVGYMRVSTTDQNLDRQRLAIGGCDKVFEDRVSGGSREGRKGLAGAMSYVREGDLLVVASMDRLARSLRDLEGIVRTLVNKGVVVQFVKEDLFFRKESEDPYAMFQLHLIGAVAELERSLIRERQREGIAAARAKGKKLGRKRLLTSEQIQHARIQARTGVPKARIARELGVSRATLYRYLEIPKLPLD